jgi:hypothetical protein
VAAAEIFLLALLYGLGLTRPARRPARGDVVGGRRSGVGDGVKGHAEKAGPIG